jgi:hypothetical protein
MASERVPLRDGPTLPVDVLEHVLDLGDRGFALIALPDGTAQIDPGGRLTPNDRAWLDIHKPEMRAAIQYLAGVCAWPLAIVGSRLTPGIGAPACADAQLSTSGNLPTRVSSLELRTTSKLTPEPRQTALLEVE